MRAEGWVGDRNKQCLARHICYARLGPANLFLIWASSPADQNIVDFQKNSINSFCWIRRFVRHERPAHSTVILRGSVFQGLHVG
jgi:hypothetical protein